MLFRDATDADCELTWQIKSRSIKPYVEKIWGWDEEMQFAFHQQDFKPDRIKIIKDDHGKDIGLLDTTEDDTSLYINNILLCDDAQGNGLGTAILTRLIHEAKSKNKRIAIQVFKVNERARNLYERLGFKTNGETEFHYQMAIQPL